MRATKQTPPYSREAEETALGGCLVAPQVLSELAEIIGPEDLFVPNHREILEAMLTLRAGSRPIDDVSVLDELRRRGSIDRPDLLVSGLIHAAATTAACLHHAKKIAELARKRRALQISVLVKQAALNGSALEELAGAAAELQELAGAAASSRPERAQVVRVADVRSERVRWLWSARIPRGKLTVLDGDPGLGKSTLTLDLAARLSTGSPLPDGERLEGPESSLILSSEDAPGDTIRPRLEAVGANLERVHILKGISRSDGTGTPPEVPADVNEIERVIAREAIALVIIDPIMAFLGSRVDSFRDQDVRRALHALAAMAERTGAAVMFIRHLTKGIGSQALYRGGGSIGIIGAARAAMLVAPDPSDKSRRVLAQTKSNLAAMPKALAYRHVEDELTGAGRVVWEGATSHSASELLAEPEDDVERTAQDEAEKILLEVLGDGPVRATEATKEARSAGVSSDRTLKRAKAAIGVVTGRVGEPGRRGGGTWWWWLPDQGGQGPVAPLTVAPLTQDRLPRSEALSESQTDLGGQEGHIQGSWPPKPPEAEEGTDPDPLTLLHETLGAEEVEPKPQVEADRPEAE